MPSLPVFPFRRQRLKNRCFRQRFLPPAQAVLAPDNGPSEGRHSAFPSADRRFPGVSALTRAREGRMPSLPVFPFRRQRPKNRCLRQRFLPPAQAVLAPDNGPSEGRHSAFPSADRRFPGVSALTRAREGRMPSLPVFPFRRQRPKNRCLRQRFLPPAQAVLAPDNGPSEGRHSAFPSADRRFSSLRQRADARQGRQNAFPPSIPVPASAPQEPLLSATLPATGPSRPSP